MLIWLMDVSVAWVVSTPTTATGRHNHTVASHTPDKIGLGKPSCTTASLPHDEVPFGNPSFYHCLVERGAGMNSSGTPDD